MITGSNDQTINLIDTKAKYIYHKFYNIHDGNSIFLFFLKSILLIYIYIDAVASVAISGNGQHLSTGSYRKVSLIVLQSKKLS